MNLIRVVFCLLLLILCAGCGPATPQASTMPALPTAELTATLTVTVEERQTSATIQSIATESPPTVEPSATRTPVPTMVPYTGTPVPVEQLVPISLTNYRDIRQVGRFVLEYENLQDGIGDGYNPEVMFSPDSRFLAYLDGERLVLWDLNGQKIERTFSVECCGLGPGIAFSPDSRLIATNGHEGPIVWDVGTGEVISQGDAPVVDLTVTDMRYLQSYTDLVFSGDGRQIITGSFAADTSVTFWDVRTGKIIRDTFPTWNGIHDIAINPDGRTIYTAVRTGQLNAFEAATGERLEIPVEGVCTGREDCPAPNYQVCWEVIRKVAVAPNGKFLVTLCHPKDPEIVPMECSDPESESLFSEEYIRGVCYTTKLFSTETWEFIGYLNLLTPALNDITFNSDGGMVAQAVGNPTSQVKLWNTMAREELFTVEGFPAEIAQAAFSPDGKLLLVRLVGGDVILFGVN